MPQGSGGGHGVVARRTHISAGELVAFATRHPVQHRESNLQSEGRLTFDMVARGTHERLRIHWGASRERKGRSYCLSVLAVANHFPSSPGGDAIRSARILLGSMPGYRFTMAREVAMLVFADVASMPYRV